MYEIIQICFLIGSLETKQQSCCCREAEWIHKEGLMLLGDSHFLPARSFYFLICHAIGIYCIAFYRWENWGTEYAFCLTQGHWSSKEESLIWIQVCLQRLVCLSPLSRLYQEGNAICLCWVRLSSGRQNGSYCDTMSYVWCINYISGLHTKFT